MLRKRERLFVLAYTDKTCHKTYQNATQSALKAGYSQRNSASQGCKLLKKSYISQEIANIETNQALKHKLTVEDKIRLLEEAIANTPKGSNQWLKLVREHGDLSGHYTQKIENKTEIIEAQQEAIREQVNQQLKDFNPN